MNGNSRSLLILCDDDSSLRREAPAFFLCEDTDGSKSPCGVCDACKKLAAGVHPDVIFADKLGKDNKYSIDAIRKLLQGSYLRPNDGAVKVFVFPHANDLSVQCQNALLKLAEEPPEYLRLLFFAKDESGFVPALLSLLTMFIADRTRTDSAEIKTGLTIKSGAAADGIMSAILARNEYQLCVAFAHVAAKKDRELWKSVFDTLLGRSREFAALGDIEQHAAVLDMIVRFREETAHNPSHALAGAACAARLAELICNN